MSQNALTEVIEQRSTAASKTASASGKIYRWALSPNTRLSNAGLRSLFPVVLVILITAVFNASPFACDFYTWLNARYTPFQINLWGTFWLTTVVYWIGGFFYMVVDLTGWPKAMKKWKIQPTRSVTWDDYMECCKVVLRNQFVVVLPICYLVARFRPLPTTTPLPSAGTSLWHYAFGLVVEEIGFYYVHLTIHHPRLYKYIHKKHHEFLAPVALSATYCTLIEHIFSNILPILGGLLLLKAHISSFWMFFCSLELGTLANHSDYNMPFNSAALQHDWHHYFFRENYGPTGLLDFIHGTNTVFVKWMAELEKEWGWESEEKARRIIAEWDDEKQAKMK